MISIIIVNYFSKQFLLKCVKSVYEAIKSFPFEVIIVNNSPEENLDELLTYENIRIIKGENKGFAYSNNRGAELANGDFFFFLNPDTVINVDCFGSLIPFFEDSYTGIIGLKLYYPDGKFQVSFGEKINIIGEIKNKRIEKLYHRKKYRELKLLEKEYSQVKRVEWVSGAALIITRFAFKISGGFCEDYFLYYEDADLCRKVNDLQHKVLFYPYSSVTHFKGENVQDDFHGTSYLHAKYSQILYYRKHCGLLSNLILRIYLVSKYSLLSLSLKKKYFKLLGVVTGIIKP